MANKKTQEIRRREQNKKKHDLACSKLKWYYIAMLCTLLVLLACYFFHWIYVYNTEGGTEVKVSGWSMFLATLFNQFTSTSAIYGDVDVPFYFYAKVYIIILGILTVVSVAVILAIAVLYAVALAKNKHNLAYVAMSLEILLLLLLIAAMSVSLAANGSQILPVYCSGNSACSVRTLIYIPLAVSAALLVTGIVTAVKYFNTEKLLHYVG